jgi:hypothetical protein
VPPSFLEDILKRCSICRQLKPFSEFGKNKNGANGLTEACKMCHRRSERERRGISNKIKHTEMLNNEGDGDIQDIIYRKPEGIITRGQGMKPFYLHTRHNGIWYVEFVDQEARKKMSARSTGKTDKNEAIEVAEKWLKNGIPDKKVKRPRSLKEIININAILNAIAKAKLSKADGYRIIGKLVTLGLVGVHLKYFIESPIKYLNKYSFEEIEEEIEYMKDAIKSERKKILGLKHQAKGKLFQIDGRKVIRDEMLGDEERKLIDLEMQHILLLRRIKKLKQEREND